MLWMWRRLHDSHINFTYSYKKIFIWSLNSLWFRKIFSIFNFQKICYYFLKYFGLQFWSIQPNLYRLGFYPSHAKLTLGFQISSFILYPDLAYSSMQWCNILTIQEIIFFIYKFFNFNRTIKFWLVKFVHRLPSISIWTNFLKFSGVGENKVDVGVLLYL